MTLGDYKGYRVEVEETGKFCGLEITKSEHGDTYEEVASAMSLSKLYTILDKISKRKYDLPVIVQEGYTSKLKEGRVTSRLAQEDYAGKSYFRVQFPNREWTTKQINGLFKLNEHNKNIAKEVGERHATITRLKSEILVLNEKLERCSLEELGLEDEKVVK